MTNKVNIEPEWQKELYGILNTKQFEETLDFVRTEYLTKQIFPQAADIFRAFWLTPFSQVKVVILGQDPYHNDGQADGLCFSVPAGLPLPPSLRNIYKEIESDLGIKKDFNSGNLEPWAEQGVFLLNTILTVVAHQAASHRHCGWEYFTDALIKTISEQHENIVFMLWGNYARNKKNLIDASKHLILEAPHPSPLSAYNGWWGSKHFSKCNQYLIKHNKKEINW
jgi:uracil-DNA glycosylase